MDDKQPLKEQAKGNWTEQDSENAKSIANASCTKLYDDYDDITYDSTCKKALYIMR